jgi:hypothetical protein
MQFVGIEADEALPAEAGPSTIEFDEGAFIVKDAPVPLVAAFRRINS